MLSAMDTDASFPSFRPASNSSAVTAPLDRRSAEVRDSVAPLLPSSRSRVTNGGKLLVGIDGRLAEARRYRDLAMSFADDLGAAASLTEAQRALIAQAAALVVQSEAMAGAAIRGEAVNVEQQTRVANALGRTLNRLGIKKLAQTKLTVTEYLAARDARRAAVP
jgi:hypothetical protein